jgi:hypothetical protein
MNAGTDGKLLRLRLPVLLTGDPILEYTVDIELKIVIIFFSF